MKSKINLGKRIELFFKRHWVAFLASCIALFVWRQEKVNVVESEKKISDFFRLESEIHQQQLAVILYQQATSYTSREAKEYRLLPDSIPRNRHINDSSYVSALSADIKNEVLQEIECIYAYRRQADLEGDITLEIDKDSAEKKRELGDLLNTGNWRIITNYIANQRKDYTDELQGLEKSSQEYLNKLWLNSKHQFNWYVIGYLVAALGFFFDKVINVQGEE